ncbi:MAG: hypothetical protein ACI8XO_004797 [Verrucomicrobiales bacterium]|jgi:hypothetical protein
MLGGRQSPIRKIGRGAAVATSLWLLLVAALHLLTRNSAAVVPPSCNLKRLTGVPCPTCGGTRSTFALVQGKVFEAIAFNPWIVALHLMIFFALVAWLLRRPQLNAFAYFLKRPKLAVVVLLGSLAANWVYVLLTQRGS